MISPKPTTFHKRAIQLVNNWHKLIDTLQLYTCELLNEESAVATKKMIDTHSLVLRETYVVKVTETE